MIIRTSAGHLYRVHETNLPDLAHCWMGVRVTARRLTHADGRKGFFYPVKGNNALPILVRKAGATVVEN
jgi:hypothetical protein